jgi:TPR repeat protein
MTTPRIFLPLSAMLLWGLPGCADQQPRPTNALTEQAVETESLLSKAENGTAEDRYELGLRYEKGLGVPQNSQDAVRWYRLSAMQGYGDAQYKLCEFSERGQGMPQDYQETLRWCGLAADQGQGRAMFMLGRLYHTAHGVPPDVVRAHMWYNLAAAHGYEEGKKWRDRLADDMNPKQIAEAQRMAREWSVKMGARNG